MCVFEMGKTTIQIDEETRKKLKVKASKRDQSYDEAIEDLLTVYDSAVPFDTRQEFQKWILEHPEKVGLTQPQQKEKNRLETQNKNTIHIELIATEAKGKDLSDVDLVISAYSSTEEVEGTPVLALVKHTEEETLKREPEEKQRVHIPTQLAEKLKEKTKETGFQSIDEYLTHLIREIITSRDEEEVKDRLEKLGYL